MKRLTFLFVWVILCNTVSAQYVIFNPVKDKSGSDKSDEQIITNYYRDIDDDISIRMEWNSGTTATDPALNSGNDVYKFYEEGKLTISAVNRNILGIVLVCSTDKGNKFFEKVSADKDNISVTSNKEEVIWTGNSKTVQLTNKSNAVWLSEIIVIVDAFCISEAKCLTLYLPYSYKMPENVTGYTIVVDKGKIKRMNVYKTGDIVPQKTPLLIEGLSGTYVCEILSNSLSAPYYSNNNLVGTVDGKEFKNEVGGTYYYYKLSYKSKEERILGFYWGTEGGRSITVPAGRCCLKVSKENAFPDGVSSASKFFSLEGILNNINEVTVSPLYNKGKIYNINGVYVGNDRQKLSKGIYIQDGKKVVIK